MVVFVFQPVHTIATGLFQRKSLHTAGEIRIMNLLDIALVVSVIVALYNIQQLKITLKEKGFPVEMLSGWVDDYRNLKKLIRDEPDQKLKIKYQKILNGLFFSLAGTVVLLAMMIRERM